MIKKIYIFGANGTGTSTLGRVLSRETGYVFFDAHSYFRDAFKKHGNSLVVNSIFTNDLLAAHSWILAGWLFDKADHYAHFFDLVIFLWVPQDIRMARLQQREVKTWGRKILDPENPRHAIYKKFLAWSAQYDTAGLDQMSKALHEQWMENLNCPVLRISGNFKLEDNLASVLNFIKKCS